MKPHSAVMKLPLKKSVPLCYTVALKGARCTLLKFGNLESFTWVAEVFFCCYLHKCVQLHKAHIIQGLLTEHAWCCIRIPLLLLWMSVLGVCSQQRGTLSGESASSGGGGWTFFRELLSLHRLVDIVDGPVSGVINFSGHISTSWWLSLVFTPDKDTAVARYCRC